MIATKSASRIAIHNVLFATDFSPASEVARLYAANLARRHEATLHLVHVLPEPGRLAPVGPGVGAPDASGYGELVRRDALEELSAAANDPQFAGLQTFAVLEEGAPAEVLHRMAQEADADLVVLGTHGRTGVRRLLLGSVAEQVLRSVPCPVLTVGPDVPAARAAQPVRTIACAVDLMEGSERTAAYACALAEDYGARLLLINVDEGDAQLFEYEETMAEVKCKMRMGEFLDRLRPACERRPELIAGFGPPAATVVRLAEEHKADLLVMGARPAARLTGLTERMLGGTAHTVLTRAHIPVLTVRW